MTPSEHEQAEINEAISHLFIIAGFWLLQNSALIDEMPEKKIQVDCCQELIDKHRATLRRHRLMI
jgi:hypothetical protein